MTAISPFFFSAPDGLRLHALSAGPRADERLPVVCLPGLARTAEDFRELIETLAFDGAAPRRVIALDSRGRGRSEADPNPSNYSVPVELGDVLAMLDAAGISRAVFVGTSRGGILTMALGAARPRAIAGAVLNDIGPVIEMAGLLRIKNYVGRLPTPGTYEEAAGLLRAVMGGQFPAFDAAAWDLFARRTWTEANGAGLEPRYDRNLAKSLETIDPAEPLPALWAQFDALAEMPLLVIRGEHSDILSRETLAAMRKRRRDLQVVEVPGQGHAPLLVDAATLGPIAKFVKTCDSSSM
jgi:pimeloyl-ACP methyl ester carboxylesterase